MGDVGETTGNVGAAGEDDALDLGADRRQRRAGSLAAIEEGGEIGIRDGLARRRDERPKPPPPA